MRLITARWTAFVLILVPVLLAGCRARRAPALAPPSDFTELLILGAVIAGLGLLVARILTR